jgi:hypothetical protein
MFVQPLETDVFLLNDVLAVAAMFVVLFFYFVLDESPIKSDL